MSNPTGKGGQLAKAEAKQQTVNVAVRVPAKLAKEFERVAVGEERTVSAEIRRLMRLRVAEVLPQAPREPPRARGAGRTEI